MIARVQSLQVRFVASLVLSVAAALATVAIMARWSTTTQFEQYVQQNRDEMQQVARKVALDTGNRVVAASADGRIFLDSSSELLGKTLELPPPPPGALGPGGAPEVMVFTRSIAAGDQTFQAMPDTLYSGSTVTTAAPTEGAATFRIAMQPGVATAFNPEDVFLSSFSRSLWVGVLVGGAVALVLALVLSRGILRPVDALTNAARGMANGRLDQRVVVRSGDEIGQLGHAFNAMAEGLTRTEQLRRTMVADVAHELRTPLTNLRGYLEALRDGVAEPGPDVLTSLYEEAVLLSQLVDDLQDLALSDAGQLTLQRDLTDVNELVTSAVRAVQPEASRRGLSVELNATGESILVWADVRRIGQVLRNLLANALTHTPAGGSITVSAIARGTDLMVNVADSGHGIPPEHMPNVFERFYRVDNSRARATGGAGIGLAVVKQLIEAHGGGVQVRSVVGVGSTFSFTLPLEPSPPRAADLAALAARRMISQSWLPGDDYQIVS
jgi:signal transduction histidine kinase